MKSNLFSQRFNQKSFHLFDLIIKIIYNKNKGVLSLIMFTKKCYIFNNLKIVIKNFNDIHCDTKF